MRYTRGAVVLLAIPLLTGACDTSSASEAVRETPSCHDTVVSFRGVHDPSRRGSASIKELLVEHYANAAASGFFASVPKVEEIVESTFVSETDEAQEGFVLFDNGESEPRESTVLLMAAGVVAQRVFVVQLPDETWTLSGYEVCRGAEAAGLVIGEKARNGDAFRG